MKTALARNIKGKILSLLFLSILILMLNSFLPVVTLQDSNEPIYLNLENMLHAQNIDIQKLYHDLSLINIIIWALIIFVFIAFFGVILDISEECQKISYLFLIIGCSSIFLSSLLCYLYYSFISKIIGSEDIYLAYIFQNLRQIRYPYIILLLLIILLLISVTYNTTTLNYVYNSFKACKEKNKKVIIKEEKQKKSFQKIDQEKKNFNNAEKINMKKFKNKKEGMESWLSTEIDRLELTENTEKQDFIKDSRIDEPEEEINIKDEEINIEKKQSPFTQDYIENEPKQKKYENSDIKLSKTFEQALISAIDKKKNVSEHQKTDKNKLQKEKNVKKYNVKCPACSFIFTTIKNEEGATKIKCPRCGKDGMIK